MKTTASIILVVSALIAVAIIVGSKEDVRVVSDVVSNVTTNEDNQVVEISAKGGYSPRQTLAKAEVPTILRMKTNATFDCSAAFTIPSINYAKNLPPTGLTDIELPPQKAGTILRGLCSMGMYNFEVMFN